MAAVSTCGLGAVLLLIALGLIVGRLMSRPVETGGAHRADETPLPLPPAPVQVIRLADRPTEEMPRLVEPEERIEEQPAPAEPEPVEHVEAAEEQPEPGAIGTMAPDESPEMADAAWRHAHDAAWTRLLVDWTQRPQWLAEFSDASLQLPQYRRLVLEHTQSDVTTAAELRAMVDAARAKAGSR